MRFDIDDVFLIERMHMVAVALRNRVETGKWMALDPEFRSKIRRLSMNVSSLARELDGFTGDLTAEARMRALTEDGKGGQ